MSTSGLPTPDTTASTVASPDARAGWTRGRFGVGKPLGSTWVARVGPCAIRLHPRSLAISTVLAIGVLIVAAVTLRYGTLADDLGEVWRALRGDAPDNVVRSVRGRRVPRLITAVLVGGALGVSGAVFQSLSRNALGSPDIIGLTTGAATAAVLQIVVFNGGMLATAVAAVAGGLLTSLIVYGLARRDGVSGGLRLVLVGIGIGAVASSITSLLMVRADLDQATVAQQWSAGSLLARGWPHAISMLLAVGVLVPALLAVARTITMIEMGDDAAHGLGIRVERYRLIAILLGIALASMATAAAGPIAFIALAAPQIVGRLCRRRGVLVLPSFFMGAILLGLADLLSQTVDVGLRTPVGTITALLGGLYLIYLLARRV